MLLVALNRERPGLSRTPGVAEHVRLIPYFKSTAFRFSTMSPASSRR